MDRLSRRGFLGMVVAAPLLRLVQLPAPLTFTPRYYAVSVPLTVDEINRVTMRVMHPAFSTALFGESPLLAYLQKGARGQ